MSGLVATQIWASTDEALLPCGSHPCCCYRGGMAVCVFSLSSLSLCLWIVFELMNDARTRKIRAGSDFDVIRTSTRTYGTYIRYKFFSTLLTSVGLTHARPNYIIHTVASQKDAHPPFSLKVFAKDHLLLESMPTQQTKIVLCSSMHSDKICSVHVCVG